MENFPLQLALVGLTNLILEPFCYGCGTFLLSFRITKTIPAKILAITLGVFSFLWVDDIWPSIASRNANVGFSTTNRFLAESLDEGPRLGRSRYNSGEQSGLWEIFELNKLDVGSAVLFIPLAFQFGLFVTGRRWDELQIQEELGITIPNPRKITPPPPPFIR